MRRAYYSNSIKSFLKEPLESILGKLMLNHTNKSLEDLQRNAWKQQVKILKNQLKIFSGYIYFEFAIPRMGKKVDNILVIGDTIFIVEFKVGEREYPKHAIDQVIDYTLDLANFHEGSHNAKLVPTLVSTQAKAEESEKGQVLNYSTALKTTQHNLREKICGYAGTGLPINAPIWENSIYKPTPTIIEAAQALYKGHNVKEISRSESGAINLSKTTACLNDIINESKHNGSKSICFVTGVPGAGKTLAGLNIANERMKTDEDEHAVFLSGNGPLVAVLREALTRDTVETSKLEGQRITKTDAGRKANAFIQNIHHFRDEYLKFSDIQPTERVVVFDEAQRAWTKDKTATFMKTNKGIENFERSEPEFLIEVMNRHTGWCNIICLIGGGQEINTGEAGLEEWVMALKNKFPSWTIHYSDLIINHNNYLKSQETRTWLSSEGHEHSDLHLSVSIRSFRTEKLSQLIYEMLELEIESAKDTLSELADAYPIVITRDYQTAKEWLKAVSRGTERTGVIASSGARRLRPLGIDVKNEISAPNWFLNKKDDVRSSYYFEDIATEFDIQGLEVDWACIAWGANFYWHEGKWNYQSFRGTKWQNMNKVIDKEYLKNTYRVLLTRARQGIVIFIPNGDLTDQTRPTHFYDGTYSYLKNLGIKEL